MSGRDLQAPKRAGLLWIVGAVLLAYAAVLAATAGLDVAIGGVRIRSRTWQRPALLGLACVVVAGVTDRRRVRALVRQAVMGMAAIARAPSVSVTGARAVTAAAIGWTVLAALLYGTYAAGGADSSGYLNQARLFSRGRLVDDVAMAVRPPWAQGGYRFTPLGYVPAPDGVRIAPSYPPGYPLLMAPAFLIDARAAYLVVPVCGALVIWLTFRLGRRLGEPAAGAVAALLVSVSPTFLHQVAQPMSDVPTTAAWLLALLLATGKATTARAALSGLAAGLAILIRPNLMPLAGLVWVASGVPNRASGGLRRACVAAVATVPAIIALGIIQAVRYGSPLASGYESFRDLFQWGHIAPNLARYPRWMFEAHTPLIALFVLAPLGLARRQPQSRSFLVIAWMFSLAVIAAYLPYVYFQRSEWMYTRFLLPALPLMWLLIVTLAADLMRRAGPPFGGLIAVPAVTFLLVFMVGAARERNVFTLRRAEQRYVRTGEFVRQQLPANGIIISGQHSGSVWFYARRPILRWDHLDTRSHHPDSFDRAVAWLTANGYTPYIVADREEFNRIRQRFGPDVAGSLERTVPVFQFGDAIVYAIP